MSRQPHDPHRNGLMGSITKDLAPIDAESVASVLSEIAEIASETLELQEVFGRVANAVRRVIPFDNMGVCRIVHGDSMVLHAADVPCADPDGIKAHPMPLSAWSP